MEQQNIPAASKPITRRMLLSTAAASIGAWALAACGGGDAVEPSMATLEETDSAKALAKGGGKKPRPGRSDGTDTTTPSVPSGLSATARSATSITLNWAASTDNVGVTGYRLYRCAGNGCTPVTQIGSSTSTSYTDSGLSPNTSYSYCVSAVDAAGNVSALSSTATVSTLNTDAPVDWVVNPSPVLTAGSSNNFDLSQTLPQGIVRGGVFSLDSSSAPLPGGVTLTSSGLLSAGSASAGSFSGLVFSYTEPPG